MKRFKLFGLRIAISREPFKTQKRTKKRTDYRDSQRKLRLEMAGHRCEVCGKEIEGMHKNCYFIRTLPEGSAERNAAANIRVMCGACYGELEKKPHALGYLQLEDETRYDAQEYLNDNDNGE